MWSGLITPKAATTATEHLVEKGFEAILFLSEPLGSVNTRRERLSAFRATLARHHGVVAENAEVQLNDGAMLDNVLRQFHARHRGMRKAVISANGALTLQVARALKRVGLIWGSDIGLLGFDELEWAGWPASVLPPSNSRRGRSATRRSNRLFGALPALTTPSANGYFPASLSSADQPPVNDPS